MPATQRGVYHNLNESKYTVSNGEIVCYFSSELYLNKFLDGHQTYREAFIEKLSYITNQNILNMATLADLTFYRQVEKRGFRVSFKGMNISLEEMYAYALRTMKEEKAPEWKRIDAPNYIDRVKLMG